MAWVGVNEMLTVLVTVPVEGSLSLISRFWREPEEMAGKIALPLTPPPVSTTLPPLNWLILISVVEGFASVGVRKFVMVTVTFLSLG
jgi:hypothetical protein